MKIAGIQLSPGDHDLSLGALPDLQWVGFPCHLLYTDDSTGSMIIITPPAESTSSCCGYRKVSMELTSLTSSIVSMALLLKWKYLSWAFGLPFAATLGLVFPCSEIRSGSGLACLSTETGVICSFSTTCCLG